MPRPRLKELDRKFKIQPCLENWRIVQLGGIKKTELMVVEFIQKKTRKRIVF